MYQRPVQVVGHYPGDVQSLVKDALGVLLQRLHAEPAEEAETDDQSGEHQQADSLLQREVSKKCHIFSCLTLVPATPPGPGAYFEVYHNVGFFSSLCHLDEPPAGRFLLPPAH